jgi:hypothetical protein
MATMPVVAAQKDEETTFGGEFRKQWPLILVLFLMQVFAFGFPTFALPFVYIHRRIPRYGRRSGSGTKSGFVSAIRKGPEPGDGGLGSGRSGWSRDWQQNPIRIGVRSVVDFRNHAFLSAYGCVRRFVVQPGSYLGAFAVGTAAAVLLYPIKPKFWTRPTAKT